MDHLNESGLSRLYRQNVDHDCGALTAFRKTYTHAENKARNRSLLAKLKAADYGVTSLHGRYPEGGKVTTEESFFVVDLKDGGTLESDLRRLGEEFEQDSILVMPKGAIDGTAKAFLVGTNHVSEWPGYGNKEQFNKGRLGYDSPIYTSYVNGRPFVFEDVGGLHESPQTGFGVWALQLASKRPWRSFLED